MLVVSKKLGESVWLAGEPPQGHKIEVKVLGVRGGSVRLGIEAPPTVSVMRDEPIVDTAGVPSKAATA